MTNSTDDEFLLSPSSPLLFPLYFSPFSTSLPSPPFFLSFLPCWKPWPRWANKRKKGTDEESKHCCDFWFPFLNETWLGHDVTWSSLLSDNDISSFLDLTESTTTTWIVMKRIKSPFSLFSSFFLSFSSYSFSSLFPRRFVIQHLPIWFLEGK